MGGGNTWLQAHLLSLTDGHLWASGAQVCICGLEPVGTSGCQRIKGETPRRGSSTRAAALPCPQPGALSAWQRGGMQVFLLPHSFPSLPGPGGTTLRSCNGQQPLTCSGLCLTLPPTLLILLLNSVAHDLPGQCGTSPAHSSQHPSPGRDHFLHRTPAEACWVVKRCEKERFTLTRCFLCQC